MGRNHGEVGDFNEESVSIDMNMALYEFVDDALMSFSVTGLAEMAAVGLDLPPKTFVDAGRYG